MGVDSSAMSASHRSAVQRSNARARDAGGEGRTAHDGERDVAVVDADRDEVHVDVDDVVDDGLIQVGGHGPRDQDQQQVEKEVAEREADDVLPLSVRRGEVVPELDVAAAEVVQREHRRRHRVRRRDHRARPLPALVVRHQLQAARRQPEQRGERDDAPAGGERHDHGGVVGGRARLEHAPQHRGSRGRRARTTVYLSTPSPTIASIAGSSETRRWLRGLGGAGASPASCYRAVLLVVLA